MSGESTAAGRTARADWSDVLDEAERRGLALAIVIRSGLLLLMMLFSIVSQDWPQGFVGAGFVGIFLAVGLAFRWLIVRGRDRWWMRYAFIGFDIVALGLAAAFAPLSTGGDVPQVFVFRVFGIDIFFFILATSALSLSPRLVLWAGAVGIVANWAAWGWVVSQMERTVSWGDLPAGAPPEVFTAIVLDPDFIGTGNRLIETLILAATSLVTAAAVGRARRLLTSQLAAERARSRVSEVFGRFVPAEVAAELARRGGEMPAAEREASVLFIDIEGSTAFAARTAPEQVIAVLDAFFDRVSAVVAEHRGVVISLIGDGALVAFNAPLDNARHAADAVAAAHALLNACETERFEGERLPVRIGIATGPVAAGTVGGQGRRAYTLYGDTVNLAQRLEAMNKETGTRVLIAAGTWAAAEQPAAFAHAGRVTARGRSEEGDVYALADA